MSRMIYRFATWMRTHKTLKEARRSLVYAMGSRCADCGNVFDPDDLIIDHIAFPSVKIGSGGVCPQRREEVEEFMRTGKIPEGTRLLCDHCNRKRHKYRPSNMELFGENP